MTALLADIASWACILAGSAFLVIGAIGLNRMPDFFARLHPAGLTDTMGAGLVLIGLVFQAGVSLIAVKLLLIMAFLYFTSPTASHATARAALAFGLQPKLAPRHEDGDTDGGAG
jgi:multicomponent Na+:H+ antiporter subunit G